MRLLVVEDEKDLNRVISKRLEKAGYSVDSCYDGAEALDYIYAGEFDAIIMDIMMPRLNGLEAGCRNSLLPTRAALVHTYAVRCV